VDAKLPTEAPMVVLDGLPFCPAKVAIAPLKLDSNNGRILLNPNETMAPRELQNERSNHSEEGEVPPFLYNSPRSF